MLHYDILWGAQNHPQLPVYYKPNGGHSQTPHVASAKDEQNKEAFLWNHFFGGESLLSPPTSSHEVDKDKLNVSVSFNEGPQPISGRIWWIYDRAPEGSAPFLDVQIPEDQWMDMEYGIPETGSWTATIQLTGRGFNASISSPIMDWRLMATNSIFLVPTPELKGLSTCNHQKSCQRT